MNHSPRVTALSSKLFTGWKIYRHLQNELQHICPSAADIPPCEFTLQVIKSRLLCKQRAAVPPWPAPALSTLAAEAGRVWCYFHLSCASNTHWSSQTSPVISYFRAHSQRDPVHTLVWLCLQSKLKLSTDQSEMAGAHSPHWTADSGQMIHHLTISHTCEDGRCKLKFMPLWTPLISTSSACLCLNKDFTRDPLAVISPVETGCFSKAGTGVGWYCKNTVKS